MYFMVPFLFCFFKVRELFPQIMVLYHINKILQGLYFHNFFRLILSIRTNSKTRYYYTYYLPHSYFIFLLFATFFSYIPEVISCFYGRSLHMVFQLCSNFINVLEDIFSVLLIPLDIYLYICFLLKGLT